MSTCTEIDPLVTPFVDEEIAAVDRARVEAHLVSCAPCRIRVTGERETRNLVRARADSLAASGPHAPPSLRTRVLASAPRGRRRFFLPVPVAAMLGLTVLGTFVHRTSPVVAAQLTLDHFKCAELRATRMREMPPHDVGPFMRSHVAGHAEIPRIPSLRFVGARRCLLSEGRMAHLLYAHGNTPVSLFIIPGAEHAARRSRAFGRSSLIWSHGGSTYALVGALPVAELQTFAGVIH